jgi:integrase
VSASPEGPVSDGNGRSASAHHWKERTPVPEDAANQPPANGQSQPSLRPRLEENGRLLTAREVAGLLAVPESWVREASVSPTSPSAAIAATPAKRSTPGSSSSKPGRPFTAAKARPTCIQTPIRACDEAMSSSPEPRWGRVWRYEGPRGVSWRIRYRDASGRRVLETLGQEPAWNRKRAQGELRRRLVDVERDGYRKPERTLFADFAQDWLNDYLPGRGLKLTTTDGYRQTLNKHLLPHFGHLPLRQLEQQPELIDRYISAKMGSGLAAKTVHNHILLLQVMLKRAVRWRLIQRNPVTDSERPRVQQPELNVLTETEIARLWQAYNDLEHDSQPDEQAWWRLARTLTFVALGTALRRGELLALRWRDIQLLEGRLNVREALVKGRFTTPKSHSSRRLIELGPQTRQLLAEHWQRSSYQGDDELVFCHPDKGTPLDPSRLAREHLKPALEHAGITKPFRPFHDLRHTALTHEAAAGNPMAYLQQRAGHSQSAITERYIHAAQILFPGAAARGEARLFSQAQPLQRT